MKTVKDKIKDIGEVVGGIAVCAMFVFLAWAYMLITPDQLSAEADLNWQDCHDNGVEYAPYYAEWAKERGLK